MADNKLIPYWITIHEKGNPDYKWDLTNIHTEEPEFPEDNLADYFESFCQSYQGDVEINQGREKTFTIDEPIKREGNTIEGVIKSGEWGRNADFYDIDEYERIEDAREENHAEEIPYYFLFHIPDVDSEQALLILRKYGRKGVKTLFRELFLPRMKGQNVGDAHMKIQPHISDKVIEKLENADSIAEVRFRGKDTIPAREKYADKNDLERIDDEISGQLEVDTELTFSPKENESKFKEFIKGVKRVKNGGSDAPRDFDYGRVREFSSASVTVVEGQSALTFALWEERLPMRMDLNPDDHNLDIHGGHPTPNSIGGLARQLANDLMSDHNESLDEESLMPSQIDTTEAAEPPGED